VSTTTSTTVEAPAGDHPLEAEAVVGPPARVAARWGASTTDLVRGAAFGAWAAAFALTALFGDVHLWAPLLYWLLLGGAIVAAGTRWRWWGVVSLAGAFGASWATWGLPLFSREAVILWLVGGLAVASLGNPRRSVWRLVAEWLPFAAVLVAYDYSRGAADALGMPLQVTPQLDVDRWLGFGHVPTVWLQQHMLDVHHVAWWEAAVSVVYLTHFVAAYVLAAWLWFRDHDAWWEFTKRFVTLSFLGVATYALVPAAPPWMASDMGKFGNAEVQRTVTRGWDYLHLHFAGRLLSEGQAGVNLTAAVPSLHAAFSALVSITLWRRIRNPFVRVLLIAYPVWMGFALVVSGEHYVVDILLGWLYAAGVTVAFDAWDRNHAKQPGAEAQSGLEPALAGDA